MPPACALHTAAECTIMQEGVKAATTFSFDLKRTGIVPEPVHMSFSDSLDVFEHIFIDFGFSRLLYTPQILPGILFGFEFTFFVTESETLKIGNPISYWVKFGGFVEFSHTSRGPIHYSSGGFVHPNR